MAIRIATCLGGAIAVATLGTPVGAAPAATSPASAPVVSVVTSAGSLMVSWQLPKSNQPANATMWVVSGTPSGQAPSTMTPEASAPASAKHVVIAGNGPWIEGTRSSLFVIEKFASRWSEPSNVVSFVPFVAPTVPIEPMALASSRSLAVSWFAPQSDGGLPVVRYDVAAAGPHGLHGACHSMVLRCSIGGLVNRDAYVVTVVAVTTRSRSAPSSPVVATPSSGPTPKAPAAPIAVSALVEPDEYCQARVSWSAPLRTPAPIAHYAVWTNRTDESRFAFVAAVPGLSVPGSPTMRAWGSKIEVTAVGRDGQQSPPAVVAYPGCP